MKKYYTEMAQRVIHVAWPCPGWLMRAMLSLLLAMLALALPTGVTRAAVAVSNCLGDTSAGSLRALLSVATNGDTITFASGLDCSVNNPIMLTSPITLGINVTIDAMGHTIVLDGGYTGLAGSGTQVFNVTAGTAAQPVVINGLTIQRANNQGFGGAINNNLGSTLRVMNCYFFSNTAFGGGAINNNSSLTVINSTFYGNSGSSNPGGAIENNVGTLSVTNSTFIANTANFGGDINNNPSQTAILTNTLVANTPSGGDLNGAFSGTNNLIDDAAHAGGFTDNTNGNIVGHDPMLGNVGSNGGGTKTFPLLPGSLAIDTGTSGANVQTTDQRGLPRINAPDIGAFESQGFTLTITGGNNQSTLVTQPFGQRLQVMLTLANPIVPLANATINFAAVAAGNGASATLSGSTATTDIDGLESVAVTANGTAGQFGVTASGAGVAGITFSLTSVTAVPVVNSAQDGAETPTNCLAGNANTCRLRDAVAAESGGEASGSTITFSLPASSTITLAQGQGPLRLSATMTIDAAGQAITVDGAGGKVVFFVLAGTGAQPVAINGLTIQHGYGTTFGGGISIFPGTVLNVTNSTFVQNTSITFGGAIYNNDGTLNVTNSTFSTNTAAVGGAIRSLAGTLNVTNSTFSGNSAISIGGGISSTGTATLTNTIVANTPSGGDLAGVFTGTNALIDDAANAGGLTDGASGNIVGHPVLLGALGSYDGATQTLPLLPGSLAIDAGTTVAPAGVTIPTTDQRGKARVNAPDIGAFESQGFTVTSTGGNNQSADVGAAFSAPLVVTVTPNNAGEPVAGGTVIFTAPLTGASATLSAPTATIGADKTVSITATANGAAGQYSVIARAAGVASPLSLTLANKPVLTTVGPVSGGAGGGNTVSLTGAGFGAPATTRVLIDGTALPAGSVTVVSGTQITFVAPGHGAGNVTVSVTVNGTTSAGMTYTYGAVSPLPNAKQAGGGAGNPNTLPVQRATSVPSGSPSVIPPRRP